MYSDIDRGRHVVSAEETLKTQEAGHERKL